jgi:hypothetical protein
MAVAELTESMRSVATSNGDLRTVHVAKVTQNDWILFPFPVGYFDFQSKTGIDEAATYAAAVVNVTTSFNATTTTVTFDGATTGQFPTSGDVFYIQVDNEIMLVTAWDGTTFTVVRAAFGTTAAVHLDDATIEVLNSVVLAGAATGPTRGVVEFMYE